MVIFYLVRHGEAQNNIRHIANSMPETEHFPLTPAGRAKVAETAEHLKKVGAVAILSSPVERTRETAGIIATATGLPVEIDDRLREVDMGAFNNALLTDFHESYPNPRLRLHTNGVDGVEGSDEMRARVVHFAEAMRKRFDGKTIIVVSHADTLEQLHGYLTGASIEEAATGWSPARGSWKKVVWE
jgi:probable phosphoglycerate mutase